MLHQNYDVGSIAAAEFMQAENVPPPSNITLTALNKEIKKNRDYIMLCARHSVHEGVCLHAMDYVLAVSQLAGKHNSPTGKKAIRKMRAAIEGLKRM